MPSLKEVKNRIASVKSTRKITSAMKMVASAKLHTAQKAIENMHPYQSRLSKIMKRFLTSVNSDAQLHLFQEKEVKQVALVVYTSNSSLCGAYNANVIKTLHHLITKYEKNGVSIKKVFTFGKKGVNAIKKMGVEYQDCSDLIDNPNYNNSREVSLKLIELFESNDVDKIDIIYHRFISPGKQVLQTETYLPIPQEKELEGIKENLDYIIEPGTVELLSKLLPLSLHLKLFTALLDAIASEHAIRVIAMQTATENADQLLQELTLQYNKGRQQAITAELLDIVGGSLA